MVNLTRYKVAIADNCQKTVKQEQTFRIKNQMDINTDEMTNTQTDIRIKINK